MHMLSAALGLVPFTVFSVLLVDVSASVGESAAAVGGLRGLGGAASVVVGVVLAATVHRFSPRVAIALGLLVLAGACLAATAGTLGSLFAFCLFVGSSTAILTPMVQVGASEKFALSADQGRAATIVTATTTLTAVAAGPVIGGISLRLDWRAIFALITVLALVLALLVLRTPRESGTPPLANISVRGEPGPSGEPDHADEGNRLMGPDTSRRLIDQHDVVALIGLIGLRTAAFMGALSLAAAVYYERHQLNGTQFAVIWSVSGLSFFVTNWFVGRALARDASLRWSFTLGGLCAVAGIILVFVATPLTAMITGTAVLAVGHAVLAATATTLLVRRTEAHHSQALALSGVAQATGSFFGAGAASLGYFIAGWSGTGFTLLVTTCAALGLIPVVLRRSSHAANP